MSVLAEVTQAARPTYLKPRPSPRSRVQSIEIAARLTHYAAVTAHPYNLIQSQERIGDLSLTMTCVRDFDEAVNDLFVALQARGEEEQLTELCPFFAKLWPSARGLCEFLMAEGPLDASCRVLEVGCGLGLPGIVATKLGATVTLSDFHDLVPEFLKMNLAQNGLPDVTYRKADWRDPATKLGEFDLVIGSDILYDRSHADDLVRFITAHLSPKGRALIADPGRAFLQEFTTKLEARGFRASVDSRNVADGAGTKDVFVLAFRRSHA